MMLPGMTISPPNFFTPRRLPRLSRPLREEPPAFLCAICHFLLVRRSVRAVYLGDAQHGLQLPVTLLAAVVLPPFLLEDDDLGGAGLLDHGGADRSALEQRRSGSYVGSVADHQHFAELDRRPGLGHELLDRDDFVLDDLVLLAAGPDHCEHATRHIFWAGSPRPRAAKYRVWRPTVNGLALAVLLGS